MACRETIIEVLKKYEINYYDYTTCIKIEIKPEIIADILIKKIDEDNNLVSKLKVGAKMGYPEKI